METAALQEAVQLYLQAFEKADLDIIRNLFARDAVQEDPVGSPPRHGIEEIVEFYRGGMAAGVKLKLTGKPRCCGDSVAFSFDCILKKMTVSPIDVFDFDSEGKIRHMRSYWGPDNVSGAPSTPP